MGPEQYRPVFQTSMSELVRPRLALGHREIMGEWFPQPGRDYHIEEVKSKRNRYSTDLTTRSSVDRESSTDEPAPQQTPTSNNPTGPPSQQFSPSYPPQPQLGPTGIPDYHFRPPQGSTTPSPYEPPGLQRTQRSPLTISPGYQAPSQYFSPYASSRNAPPPPSQMASLIEGPSPHRNPQFRAPSLSNLAFARSNYPEPSSMPLGRPLSLQTGYSSGGYSLPMNIPMPPPPPAYPRAQPSQVHLPPLQTLGQSNAPVAAVSGLSASSAVSYEQRVSTSPAEQDSNANASTLSSSSGSNQQPPSPSPSSRAS